MAPETETVSEVWECTTGGTVWVQLKDTRNIGAWRPQKVGGKANRKLRITVEEREFNQDMIPYDDAEILDPFKNGLLVRTHPKPADKPDAGTSDADLISILTQRSDEKFEAQITGIQGEIILRRLLALAETHSSYTRHQFLDAVVRERYQVGKTQAAVRDQFQEEDESSFKGLEV